MSKLNLESRIKGCLVGCAIGAELGFSRFVKPEMFAVKEASEIFNIKLQRVTDYKEERGRVIQRKVTPFIDLGVRTYLQANGRATPEDFGKLLKDDPELSAPVHLWDGIHTTQELLKEGMNPRLSGLGVAPSGIICAAMPAVGIYHFADSEYAYLDGVELASVAQPRTGADWAGLCAAAIAAAFDPYSTPQTIVDTTLKIALRNNKDVFYLTNLPLRQSSWLGANEQQFIEWWINVGGCPNTSNETWWIAYNPISFILPLLNRYADDPYKLMTLLLLPWNNAHCVWNSSYSVSPVIAGAILGARGGEEIFPDEWREWATPIAEKWFPIIELVRKRGETEKTIITVVNRLKQEKQGEDSLLIDKIHGCILAGAIGNAMGSVVEGWFYWEVDKKYPDGITTVLDPRRLEGEDDNQMAMHLVETYIERDGLPVMARHFGHTWYERLNRDHFYPHCMGNSYDLIRKGWDPRITGHWNVVTGSTVMCMEPVGIYHLADPEFAAIDATAISYMYQRGLDVVTAAILCSAVAEALKPNATVDTICDVALKMSPKNKLLTFDNRPFESVYHYLETCLTIADKYDDVFAVRPELYEKCLLYHMIDPLEVLGFALAIFKVAKGDIRQAAIGGTNIGRDSDTIAGRSAMLAGALNGASSVPNEWVNLFKPESLEKIRRNAIRFAELISTKKTERMQKRQDLVQNL
jgi:ADP-ribosylglycohydrolase